ncbi:Phosphoglucomutase-3 [Rhizoclosmatium sp. JEL0117]|nr:Phosphoglucomutase-3 [Rhizoclosmatium sp. JEL0117]
MDATLAALAQKWLALDQNESTRAEIEGLIAANDIAELQRRLGSNIKFGTAGLRAAMEAGFSRMNGVTVIQASQGLAAYIERTVPNAKERGVVVGHDHRHNSETFARLTAAVFLTFGFKVYFYRSLVHTPMVPFAIKHLNLAGGVMITASHNPKADNGYKVYWENSAQIIPPHDAGIAAEITARNDTVLTWDVTLVDTHPNCINDQTEILKDAYFSTINDLIVTPPSVIAETKLQYVYTPMHGVGFPFAERVLKTFGMPEAVAVPEQVQPDPEFSTVAFPNPEEKGALNLAIALAESKNIGLVLANDPDADRFAVAEKKADGSGWHIFTGDQIGTLLGYALVLKMKDKTAEEKKRVAMVNSAVSSKMLRSMCLKEGHLYEETLTGFKWMSNRVVDLAKEGYDTFFAYEEAIGFMTHDCVLDKDGVTALASFVELAILQKEKGSNMYELLEELYSKYGFHASDNYYFICHEPKVIAKIFERIRFGDSPDTSSTGASIVGADGIHRTNFKRASDGAILRYPLTVAGFPVTYIRDLTVGFQMSDIPSFVSQHQNSDVEIKEGENVPTLPVSSSSEMITFELANEVVFTLRTSGTEPKIKYYIEKKGTDRDAVRTDLSAVVKAVGDELFEASKNNLK